MFRSIATRTFITNIAILIIGLVNSILLARWLGPTGRGEVAAAMLWPSVLILLGSTGLVPAVLYFIAKPDTSMEDIYGNSLFIAIFQSAITVSIGHVALPWLLANQSSEVISASRLYLTIIPISLASQYGISILQGRLHFNQYNFLRSILPVGYLIGTTILFLYNQLSLAQIITLHIALQAATLFATLFALANNRYSIWPRFDTTIAKPMLTYGIKVAAGMTSQVANLRMDQILLAAWLPPTELGLYVAALSAVNLLQVISSTIRTTTTPKIAQQATKLDQFILLSRAFRQNLVISLFAAGIMAILIPYAIPLLFGAEFRASIGPAEVLLIGGVVLGARNVLTGAVQAMGLPGLASRADIIGLGATAFFLVLLLPKFGIMGAAIASVTAYSVQLGVLLRGLYIVPEVQVASLFTVDYRDIRLIFAPLRR